MKHHIAIRARRESWAIAVLCFAVFCWLGFAAGRFGAIWAGLEVNLPVATRLLFTYGPTAFPLFGVVAAVALLLSDTLFHSRWMQWVLIVVFAVAVILALRAMLISGVFMGPAHRANKPDAVNPAIARSLDARGHWRGVTDPGRSAT